MFPDDELPGIDYVIPDFSYALAKREGFRAVVLTHGHEDHIGALPYLLREHSAAGVRHAASPWPSSASGCASTASSSADLRPLRRATASRSGRSGSRRSA